jgi:hypothetical protein
MNIEIESGDLSAVKNIARDIEDNEDKIITHANEPTLL